MWKKCQDWTILRDSRPCKVQVDFDGNRGNRDTQLFDLELKFEPLFVLQGAHMTLKSIRHQKLLDIMCKKCQDWTTLRDFRPRFPSKSIHTSNGLKSLRIVQS